MGKGGNEKQRGEVQRERSKLTNRQKKKRVVVETMSEQPWQSAVDVTVAVFLKMVVVGPGQPHELLTTAVVVVPSLFEQVCAELW